MKVVEIQERFGIDRLGEAERPEPMPGPGQVALRMRAASLNYRDWLTVEGRYNPRQTLPLIPCSDGIGEVVAIGDGVDRVRLGERVLPIFAQGWLAGRPHRDHLRSTLGGPLDGTLAERMVLDASGVVPAPPVLSDEQAATLPCAGLTAWSALVTHARVQPGEVVLIQGTGGVSLFCVQLACILGARAIVLSGSEEKLARAATLGAWATLHYRAMPQWAREVRRLTDGLGVDVVVDIGGAETLGPSLEALRSGGTICLVGNVTGNTHPLHLPAVFMRQVRLQGVLVGPREGLEELCRAAEVHRLQPQIDRVFDLTEARAAFEHLQQGRHFGKICIRIP